jgi:hypothetical protein
MMPLLFFFPAIVAAGLFEAASHDLEEVHAFWFGRRE